MKDTNPTDVTLRATLPLQDALSHNRALLLPYNAVTDLRLRPIRRADRPIFLFYRCGVGVLLLSAGRGGRLRTGTLGKNGIFLGPDCWGQSCPVAPPAPSYCPTSRVQQVSELSTSTPLTATRCRGACAPGPPFPDLAPKFSSGKLLRAAVVSALKALPPELLRGAGGGNRTLDVRVRFPCTLLLAPQRWPLQLWRHTLTLPLAQAGASTSDPC